MGLDYTSLRRARTRSLIQAGGLLEKSGILHYCGLEIGADFQNDLTMKDPISLLMGALMYLKSELLTHKIPHSFLIEKGLKALAEGKDKDTPSLKI